MKNGILLIVQSCLILLSIYPIVGSVNWFIGGLSYKYLRKSKKENLTSIIDIAEPFITIMVSAHNEEIMIADTIKYLST
ncbi:MAG: glycosyl transferase, partial [Liquorilactobacillus sp.]